MSDFSSGALKTGVAPIHQICSQLLAFFMSKIKLFDSVLGAGL
jgi:hypothetical protein